MSSFYEVLKNPRILENLDELNFFEPTEIQRRGIPFILAGKDLLAIAQTGTGKTAAFVLPLIENLLKDQELSLRPKALILVPTRELCLQIHENIQKLSQGTNLKSVAIYGGVKQIYQAQDINAGVHFIVATLGRLLDLVRKDLIHLRDIEVLVLDEADRMLDMGFRDDLKAIQSDLINKKQTLMFSATIPKDVRELAESILVSPEFVEVKRNFSIPEHISQVVYRCDVHEKLPLLKKVITEEAYGSVLIFTNTKKGADDLADYLNKNHIECRAIHSDRKQADREKSIALFTSQKLNVLVATDVVARGIDVDHVSFVINFDLPIDPETYVHRIGRTGRASRRGSSVSFCSKAEEKLLEAIEKLIDAKLS